MNFSQALECLKEGRTVYRSGWNGAGMYLAIQQPDAHSANKQPYIYIVPKCGQRVPWVASQPDLLGNDWWVREDHT